MDVQEKVGRDGARLRGRRGWGEQMAERSLPTLGSENTVRGPIHEPLQGGEHY